MHPAPDRRPTRRLSAATAALGATLALLGCGSFDGLTAPDAGRVAPEDFVAEQASPDPVAATTSPGDAEATTTDASAADTPGAAGRDRAYAVDAMLGHVNGEAIYAHTILDPVEAELAAFGRRYDGDEFLRRAAPVLAGRMREVLIDKLILAEAGSGLSEREWQAVAGMVQARREELLRFYGQGSLAKARAEFLAAEDMELDEALAQYREELVVRRYLQQELMPQINVQQRDVERRFNDMMAQGVFNTEDRRVIRLMMTRDAVSAEVIARKLADGDAFESVARDETLNSYNPTSGGEFNSGEPITGDQVLGVEEVNAVILGLAQGEHAGPITAGDRHFFVQVQTYVPGADVQLRDVQVELEQRLRLEQWDALFRDFRESLWNAGGYTDPVLMTEKLLDIAIARYDTAG
jgi:hypothetical protein